MHRLAAKKNRLSPLRHDERRPNHEHRAASLLSLSMLLLPVAQAQSAASPGDGAADSATSTVVVTGSVIKSADRVGFNQVQQISQKEILASGATTISEFLRDLPVNSASSWGDDFAYGATGGSGIALRGLSEKYTLVLVDGQRAAPYAEPSNGTDSFVDLNSLPLNAIERVEIVKTGAVSQYGSDAVAGVVNIITKKYVKGLEIGGSAGSAIAGTEKTRKFDVVGGLGDFSKDRWNVTGTASYFVQDGYTIADRANTRNQDKSNLVDGVNTQGADYWEPTSGNAVALSPCPSGGTTTSAGSLLNGTSAGTACAVDTANGTSLHPHEERLNAKIHAAFLLADDTEAYADFWGSHNTTVTKQGYDGIGDSTESYDLQNVTISQVSNVVSASNPYNPYGVATPITYTFLGHPQVLTTTGNFYRVSAGAEGSLRTASLGAWDWTVALGHSESAVHNTETGLLSTSGLANILQNGVFDFADPSATPNGLAGLYTSDHNSATYKLTTVDASASTPRLARLPAGDVALGLGLQFRRESQVESDYPSQAAGAAIPFFLQAIDGARNVEAAYYQVNIPVVSTLTFSQSTRYDHYSDFGNAYSPRFALRFKPIEDLATYASFSRGFRAPTLAENSQSNSSGIQQATDPNSPIAEDRTTPFAYPVLVRGNPELRPERTDNFNLGFVYSPNRETEIGLDAYRVRIDNVIGTGNIQSIIDANDPSVVIRNPNGTIAYVNFDYENLNSLETNGLELTARRGISTPYGTVTTFGDATWVAHFKQTSGGVTQEFAGNDGAINTPFGASFPQWKGNAGVNWLYQSFDTTLTWQYTGKYKQEQESTPTTTSAYSQFNLNESYTGFKNWTISATVKNLFNRAPPYYPLWLQFPTHVAFDQSLYNDEGRFLEFSLRYKF